eukprot:502914-Pyramimonas_sp.AAC.1
MVVAFSSSRPQVGHRSHNLVPRWPRTASRRAQRGVQGSPDWPRGKRQNVSRRYPEAPSGVL